MATPALALWAEWDYGAPIWAPPALHLLALVAGTRLRGMAAQGCDALVERFGGVGGPASQRTAARALGLRRALAAADGQGDLALRLCDEAIGLYGGASDRRVRGEVALAFARRGLLLRAAGRAVEALPALAEAEARAAALHGPFARELEAMVLLQKALLLGRLDRFSQAMRTYDDLLLRLPRNAGRDLREMRARALYCKGQALLEHGTDSDAEEALQVLRAAGQLAGRGRRLRAVAAGAMADEAWALAALGRLEASVGVCAQVEGRFRRTRDRRVRWCVVTAVWRRSRALCYLHRRGEEVCALDALLRMIGRPKTPKERDALIDAHRAKLCALAHIGRDEDLAAAVAELDRWTSRDDPDGRRLASDVRAALGPRDVSSMIA